VAPTMARVGTLWAHGEIDVYQEHLTTQRLWSLCSSCAPSCPCRRSRRPSPWAGHPRVIRTCCQA
jgi:hypothetical protein